MKNRKPNRLKNYDYSQNGLYYITICTKDRINWFGKIINARMELNKYGKIVQLCWDDLINHYKNAILDAFVIMPNHIHGVIEINDIVGNGLKPFPTITTPPHGLSEIVRGFKTFSSRRINEIGKGFRWQKSFNGNLILKIFPLPLGEGI